MYTASPWSCLLSSADNTFSKVPFFREAQGRSRWGPKPGTEKEVSPPYPCSGPSLILKRGTPPYLILGYSRMASHPFIRSPSTDTGSLHQPFFQSFALRPSLVALLRPSQIAFNPFTLSSFYPFIRSPFRLFNFHPFTLI